MKKVQKRGENTETDKQTKKNQKHTDHAFAKKKRAKTNYSIQNIA